MERDQRRVMRYVFPHDARAGGLPPITKEAEHNLPQVAPVALDYVMDRCNGEDRAV